MLDIFFLAILMRSSIQIKESHQICELTMNISKYL